MMLSRLIEQWEDRIHRVLDELEDPEMALDESLRSQAELLVQVRSDIDEMIADELRTREELDRHRAIKSEWGDKAAQALAAGREDQAREALARGLECELIVRDLEKTYYRQKQDTRVLTSIIEKMEKSHAELDRNQAVLLARVSLAEIDKSLAELRATYILDPQGGATARMRARSEKVGPAEQRRLADNELELEFASLEADLAKEKVQAKLAHMKDNLHKK